MEHSGEVEDATAERQGGQGPEISDQEVQLGLRNINQTWEEEEPALPNMKYSGRTWMD